MSAHALDAETGAETQIAFSVGYRTDDLDWNIAGDKNGGNPNILSELVWSNIDIEYLQVKGSHSLRKKDTGLFLKGQAGYGRIVDGRNRDSDYGGDNRTKERYRSLSDADNGSVVDLSVALGPLWSTHDRVWSFAPLIGYSYHEQNLTLTDGYISIPAEMAIDGLNSSYDTNWVGPWFGAQIFYNPSSKWSFSSSIEYHRTDYSAKADWNLRDDFMHPVSFEHTADGTGWTLSGTLNYALSETIHLGINGNYTDWHTDSGLDRLYLANGSMINTALNRVNWISKSLDVMLTWIF